MPDHPHSLDREHAHLLPTDVQKSNYAYLFAGLSLLLLVGPGLDQLLPKSTSAIINAACLSGALFLGILSLSSSRIAFWFGLLFAVTVTVAVGIDLFLGQTKLSVPTLIVLMAFLLLSVWHAGRDVVLGGEVDWNRVVGAICIYEMLGLIWAVMYVCIVSVSPDAFAGDALNAAAPFWDFVYYSFVTLTTLGYGDVTPHGAFAKSLTYMEAVVGQLYIAILIASLIGSRRANRKRD